MEFYRSEEIFSTVVGNPVAEERQEYSAYRIPGIVVSQAGTVLTYWESRDYERNRKGIPGSLSDECYGDLFVRRSVDGGRSLGPSHR